jgi:hypothetical protein
MKFELDMRYQSVDCMAISEHCLVFPNDGVMSTKIVVSPIQGMDKFADQHGTYTKLLLEDGSYGEGVCVREYSLSFFSGWARRRVVRSVSHFACQEGYLVASLTASSQLLPFTCLQRRCCSFFCYESLCCQTKTAETDWLWRNHAVAGFENNIRRRQGDHLGVTLL